MRLAWLAATAIAALGCNTQPLYCAADRFSIADAGNPLGSPFDAPPPTALVDPDTLSSPPATLVLERDKPPLDRELDTEYVTEITNGETRVLSSDRGRQFVYEKRGGEERLRFGFSGKRCPDPRMKDGALQCGAELHEHYRVDMTCGHSQQWLLDHRPRSAR